MTAQSLEQTLLNDNSRSMIHKPITSSSAASSEFDKFAKLSKISKLRDLLRADRIARKHQFSANNYDLIDYLKGVCANNSIAVKYVQYVLPGNAGFYGEIFLEAFRIVCEENKKRKKCMYYAYKSALELLCSNSELAVKVASRPKRDATAQLDMDNESDFLNSDVEFEYELYRVDSDQGVVRSSSNRNVVNAAESETTMSLPPVLDDLFRQNRPVAEQNASLHDLNMMLKSMILPKSGSKQEESVSESDRLKETTKNDVNDNDDDDDDDKSQEIDKRTK